MRQTWFYRSKVVYFDGYRFAFDLLQKAISHTGFLRDLPRWKWWSLCSWKLIHHHCADAQNTTRWNKSWVLLTNQIWIFAPKSKSNVKTKKSWKHRVWLFGWIIWSIIIVPMPKTQHAEIKIGFHWRVKFEFSRQKSSAPIKIKCQSRENIGCDFSD